MSWLSVCLVELVVSPKCLVERDRTLCVCVWGGRVPRYTYILYLYALFLRSEKQEWGGCVLKRPKRKYEKKERKFQSWSNWLMVDGSLSLPSCLLSVQSQPPLFFVLTICDLASLCPSISFPSRAHLFDSARTLVSYVFWCAAVCERADL